MICPLHDSNGDAKTLSSIEFDDFKQLKEIEEGYAVEYKSTWDLSVQKKVPKIITSFANANGGWLFVGICNDGTYAGISRTRSDFDQTIAQIVRRHISPLPRFETRYVEDGGSGKGVLVVEIQEGIEPPYIADGSVFVRVGSSSEQFTAKADSHILIDLHQKARRKQEEIEQFCHRTVYFPPTQMVAGSSKYKLPIVDIFLKILHPARRPFLFADFDEMTGSMLRNISSCGLTGYICQHSHSSLIFKSGRGNIVDNVSPTIELFHDGSIKLSVPLTLLQAEEREEAIRRLQKLRPIQNIDLVQIVDGKSSIVQLLTVCSAVKKYAKERGRHRADFAEAYEFENLQGTIVEFSTSSYSEYVQKHGFPCFGTIDERTPPVIPENGDIDQTVTCSVLVRFFEGFGLPFATNNENIRKEVLAVTGLSHQEGMDFNESE